MSLPGGVSTCTVTFGTASNYQGVEADEIEGVLVADRNIVHAASGRGLYAAREPVPGSAGYLSFVVPHVDQAGMVDAQGAAVTNWFYTLYAVIRFGAERIEIRKRFQVFVGETTKDLDLQPDGPVLPGVTIPTTGVLSVAGHGGVVTVEQLAADLVTPLSTSFVPADAGMTIVRDATTGLISSVTEGSITTTYTRDGSGKIATQTRLGVTRTYARDASGNLTGVA